MNTSNTSVLMFQFTQNSVQDLLDLAGQLNTTPQGVLGQALALLKVSQGNHILLQRGNKTRVIDRYVSTNHRNHKSL